MLTLYKLGSFSPPWLCLAHVSAAFLSLVSSFPLVLVPGFDYVPVNLNFSVSLSPELRLGLDCLFVNDLCLFLDYVCGVPLQ